eukprot:909291-Rhodomonas_salina.4
MATRQEGNSIDICMTETRSAQCNWQMRAWRGQIRAPRSPRCSDPRGAGCSGGSCSRPPPPTPAARSHLPPPGSCATHTHTHTHQSTRLDSQRSTSLCRSLARSLARYPA